MRKVLIGLGLAGALALGFGKVTTARADDNTPSTESAKSASDKAQGAANSAEGAAKSAGDEADKAANSASDATKSAGEATDKAVKDDSADKKADIPTDKTKGMNSN
jgi:hypothetical protein